MYVVVKKECVRAYHTSGYECEFWLLKDAVHCEKDYSRDQLHVDLDQNQSTHLYPQNSTAGL